MPQTAYNKFKNFTVNSFSFLTYHTKIKKTTKMKLRAQ